MRLTPIVITLMLTLAAASDEPRQSTTGPVMSPMRRAARTLPV